MTMDLETILRIAVKAIPLVEGIVTCFKSRSEERLLNKRIELIEAQRIAKQNELEDPLLPIE